MRKGLTAFILGVLLIIGFNVTKGSAVENLPFTVTLEIPTNQETGIKNYVSIKSKENSIKQSVTYKVTNRTAEDRVIEIKPVDAYTSPNGVLQNTDEEGQNREILNKENHFTKYTTSGGEYLLKGNETLEITMTTEVDNYEGTLLGGISFKDNTKGADETEGEGFKVKNEIQYIISTKIDFTTKDKEPLDLDFGTPYIDEMPAYFAIRLPTTFNHKVLQRFDVDYEVLHKGKTLFANKQDFVFAPMTKVNIAFPWSHEELEVGVVYTLKGSFNYTDKDSGTDEVHSIPFELDFKYEKDNIIVDQAKQITTKVKEGFNWVLWGLVALLVALGIWIFFILSKRKRAKEEQGKENLDEEVKD